MARDKKVFTLPNILSFLRILMIPLLVWTYIGKQRYGETAIILALSFFTDFLDGFLARKLNMVSDLGKAIDPVADKLTQAAMLFCLATRFRLMLLPFVLLAVKEVSAGIMGLLILKRNNEVFGADWHGKVSTFLLYVVMAIHILWSSIPKGISAGLITLCVLFMLFSGVVYTVRNVKELRKHNTSNISKPG